MKYQDVEQFKNTCGYTIEGVWYPRVTKILEIKAKPGLENFFKEIGHYSLAEDVKNKSAEEGSLIHAIVGKLAIGESVEVPKAMESIAAAFLKFQKEYKIQFYPEFIERQILSSRYRYAGTVDALVLIGGKFGVLDIKTSAGFYPEYNLQTAAYVAALQEFASKRVLALPQDVATRWILRVDQRRECGRCGAFLREKGGRNTIKNGKRNNGLSFCAGDSHEWGSSEGLIELREFPYNLYKDTKAFIAAKILWEWEYGYWLRQMGYLK